MRFVVDTSVWLAAFFPSRQGDTAAEDEHRIAARFVDAVIDGQHKVVLPYSVVSEVVCRLARHYRDQNVDDYFAERWGEQMLRIPHISWIDVDRAFAYWAAMCGRQFRLSGMDALVAYAAFIEHCNLVSRDREHLRMEQSINGIAGNLPKYRQWANNLPEIESSPALNHEWQRYGRITLGTQVFPPSAVVQMP